MNIFKKIAQFKDVTVHKHNILIILDFKTAILQL